MTRRLRRTVAAAAAGSLVLAGSAAAGTLDQEQPPASNPLAASFIQVGDTTSPQLSGNVRVAQTFTAGVTGMLDEVAVVVARVPSAGDVTVEVRDVTDGAPGVVLATELLPAGSIPTDFADWASVPLSPAVPSVAGRQYAITLSAGGCSTPSGGICAAWMGPGAGRDVYPGGQSFASIDGAPWTGWDFAPDLSFRTFVAPPPVPAVPDLVAASDSGASSTDDVTNVTDPVFALDTALAGCTVELLFDGQVVAAPQGRVANPAEGTYDVTARTNCGDFGTSAESAALKLVIDRTAPATTIDGGPSGQYAPGLTDLRLLTRPVTDDTTPSFTFSVNESATFECGVDGGALAACRSPLTTGALGQGRHALAVRATDVAGNIDASPATLAFTVAPKCPILGIGVPGTFTICL